MLKVGELPDLFSEEQVFIAFGKDKYSADDFKISDTGMYVNCCANKRTNMTAMAL